MFRPIRKKLTSSLLKFLGERRFEQIRYVYYQLAVRHAGYTKEYYAGIEASNSGCYDLLAGVLTSEFQPEVLVDIGCGGGAISTAFLRHGCRNVFAFDGSPDAVEIARARGIPNVKQLNLTEAHQIGASGDLCVCLEVAEHVPEKYAEHLCSLLATPAPVLIFTAAPPGQGGHLHVNMQPRSYWIERFAAVGMSYDPSAVERVRQQFAGCMIRDYDENLMIFRRQAHL